MQRRILIGALLAVALTGIGGGMWFLTHRTEPEVASSEPTRPEPRRHARRGERHGEASDPMHDANDDSPVTPPDRLIALIPPHDPRLAKPDTTPVKAPTKLPNVVVMLGCTIRKDQLSPYGADSFITPRLDALAKGGTLFDDVIAAAPWTRAASTAILTGRHALEIGMVEPSAARDDSRVPDGTKTLAEYMRARGYLTIGASSNPNLSAVFGFDRGFDAYQPGLPDKWGAKLPGRAIADAVLGALKEKRDAGDNRPVYLRTMMLDAHAPRSATGDALMPFREDGVPERVAQYRYHLHKLDDAIGYFMDQLASMGLDQSNTVFVFVGDHGEGMNYPGHHGFGHGQYFGSSSVYVPWIMSGVGVAHNHKILGLASQVDVLPTLLGVIGAPLAKSDPTDGQDFSALVRGNPGVIERDHVVSDTWFSAASRAAIFTPYLQCQQDFGSSERQQRKGKFVAGCYDRVADPLFARPLPDSDPRAPQLAVLQTTLADWRKAGTDALASLQHQNAPVSADLAEQLGALGYVDAEEAGGDKAAKRAKP